MHRAHVRQVLKRLASIEYFKQIITDISGVNMTNNTAENNSERQQRLQTLLDDIKETQRLNLVGLEFLSGIIKDNSDRVYHGVVD